MKSKTIGKSTDQVVKVTRVNNENLPKTLQQFFWAQKKTVPKLKRGLGLGFGAYFLHDFSIKMFLI